MIKHNYYCSKCGSTDVASVASAEWNYAAQCWELCWVQDSWMECKSCGAENSVVKHTYDDPGNNPECTKLVGTYE